MRWTTDALSPGPRASCSGRGLAGRTLLQKEAPACPLRGQEKGGPEGLALAVDKGAGCQAAEAGRQETTAVWPHSEVVA